MRSDWLEQKGDLVQNQKRSIISEGTLGENLLIVIYIMEAYVQVSYF